MAAAEEYREASNLSSPSEDGSSEEIASDGLNGTKNSDTDIVKLVKDIAKQYAGLICVEHTKEFEQFGDIVEDLLTKLDDFLGYADLIRGDVNMALGVTLDAVHSKTNALKSNFAKIDKLEVLICTVKKDLALLEASIDQAELDLGTINPIKKALNSFTLPSLFAPKSTLTNQTPARPGRPSYRHIQTFQTSDFFPSNSTSAQFSGVIGAESNADVQYTIDAQSSNLPKPSTTERTDALKSYVVKKSDVQIVSAQSESLNVKVPLPASDPLGLTSEQNARECVPTEVLNDSTSDTVSQQSTSDQVPSKSLTGSSANIDEKLPHGSQVPYVLTSSEDSSNNNQSLVELHSVEGSKQDK